MNAALHANTKRQTRRRGGCERVVIILVIIVPRRFFLFSFSSYLARKRNGGARNFSLEDVSLSLVLCAKRRLFRETETPTTFSLLSLKRFRFDRGEKTTTRAFVLEDFRARVFKFVVDRWEKSIPKSFALCLCPVLLSRQKDARKTSPASTRSLSTVSQRPRVSPGRVFASVKRERNDPKFVRKFLFFPLSFILQLSAHNFHRGLARANRRRAARSFQTQHTPGEDDDDEDEERRERICRDCLLLLPLYERVLLSFSLKMCCLLCVMTSNTILIFYR